MDIQPGSSRDLSPGTIGTLTYRVDLEPVTISFNLPPVRVAAAHVLEINPAIVQVGAGQTASCAATLTNRLTEPATWALEAIGLSEYGVELPASVSLAAGESTVIDIEVTPPHWASAGRTFSLVATVGELKDTVQAQVDVFPSDTPAPESAVHVELIAQSSTTGQGTLARYVAVVTNVGSENDEYVLEAVAPDGLTATFAQDQIAVAPGSPLAHQVPFTLAADAGASPGSQDFSIVARSVADPSVEDEAVGEVQVSAAGVTLTFSSAAVTQPGTVKLSVRNTGSIPDTFKLDLGGVAGVFATLAEQTVTLDPEATVDVDVTLGSIELPTSGLLHLVALATSATDPNIVAHAETDVIVARPMGVSLVLEPTSVVPDPAGFATATVLCANIGQQQTTYVLELEADPTVQARFQTSVGTLDRVDGLTIPPGGSAILQLTVRHRVNGVDAQVTVVAHAVDDTDVRDTATLTVGGNSSTTGGAVSDDGCGCQTYAPQPLPRGGLAMVLACLLALALGRRRRGA